MSSLRSNRFLLGALVLLAVGASPARADKCNGAKIKAIGKKASGLLGCSAKEATKTVNGCETAVSGKFSAAYSKPTGCSPAAPSESQCESAADSCQTMIRAVLPDGSGSSPSKCEASRLKAAGKLAPGELGCYSKAAAKGVAVDPGCISKATGKFTAAFNKVSGCTGDGMASTVQTDVENDCVKSMVNVSGGNFVAITCGAGPTTTTTTVTTTTSTTTTICASTPTGTVVKGSLTPTFGRFNYNATLGLAGANAACNTSFPGSHACTIQDLQSAPASDLACLKDIASTPAPVTSFWAIDSTAPILQQCNDDAVGGSGINWEYGTAHTASRGEQAPLNNSTGALGAVQVSIQCNISGTSWVGCCQ